MHVVAVGRGSQHEHDRAGSRPDGWYRAVGESRAVAPGDSRLILELAAHAEGGVLIGFGDVEGGFVGVGATARLAVGIALLVAVRLIFRGLTTVIPGRHGSSSYSAGTTDPSGPLDCTW